MSFDRTLIAPVRGNDNDRTNLGSDLYEVIVQRTNTLLPGATNIMGE